MRVVRGQPIPTDAAVVATARWDGAFGPSERKMPYRDPWAPVASG
jgi:hypothetical protein